MTKILNTPNILGMTNEFACEIIDLFGGTYATARLAGVKPPSVSAWRENGIPPGQLIALAPSIEKKSMGKYTRMSLFPDRWHLIWPELQKEVV